METVERISVEMMSSLKNLGAELHENEMKGIIPDHLVTDSEFCRGIRLIQVSNHLHEAIEALMKIQLVLRSEDSHIKLAADANGISLKEFCSLVIMDSLIGLKD